MSRQSRIATRQHALDEEGSGIKMSALREAHGNMKEACDALGEMFENKKFAFAGARDHCKAAMDHAGEIHKLLGGQREASGEDDEITEAERDRKAKEASDADPDHRKDFDPIKGKDSAMALDYEALFQCVPDSARLRGEAFASRYYQGRGKQKSAPKATPRHAQDKGAAAFEPDTLFQRNR